MATDEEEQDYDDTIDENEFMYRLFTRYPSCKAFLSRTEKVYVRSVRLDNSAYCVWLNTKTDVDGCVIELRNLSGLSLPLRHLTVCPSGGLMKNLKNILKKHIDLTKYSSDALFNFNHSFGFQLFYDQGWECWIGLIPDFEVRNIRLTEDIIRRMSTGAFKNLADSFRLKLLDYAKHGIAKATLQKNNLSDMRRLFVLPDDIPAILDALQSAVASMSVMYFEPIVFCFRFGEKMDTGLSLSGFKRENIKKMTVHAAVNISSEVDGIDLLWSMQGIQELVGARGTLGTCLSLTDCGNFQSNLDGKAIDIKPELRRVCLQPEKLKFVQLYADVPHLKPKTRFHPVSGIIAGRMCFPKLTAEAFTRDAKTYVSVLDQNFALLSGGTCRLEVVSEPRHVSDTIQATDILDLNELNRLLQTKGLLVPMGKGVISCIWSIGQWLSKELKDMLSYFARTGNVDATWRSYQFELACEKLLWGHPLCNRSFRYSINLGPGVIGPSRSLSDELGFLALEPHTSCMISENSIPPPQIWTASDRIAHCILRSVGLHDHIDASYPVLGQIIVSALLKDLYEIGKVAGYIRYEMLAALKARDTNFQTVGAVTVDSLVELLVAKRKTGVYMVYGNLCTLLEKNKMPVKDIVKAGIIETGLHHFPAVQTYDVHRNAILTWNVRRNFWKIIACSSDTPTGTCPELYTELVSCELERRGVIFASKLKKLPVIWPWIAPCVRKLSQERLTQASLTVTLSFLSAIALVMQGWYIDFDRFNALLQDIPVKQFRLKCLEIQSKLQLAKLNFTNVRIFRLHESIPHRLEVREKEDTMPTFPTEVTLPTDEAEIETPRLINEHDIQLIERTESRAATCQPVGLVNRLWSPFEIELLCNLAEMKQEKTYAELFDLYRTRCMGESVPFRTFRSFKAKLLRLKEKVK